MPLTASRPCESGLKASTTLCAASRLPLPVLKLPLPRLPTLSVSVCHRLPAPSSTTVPVPRSIWPKRPK